MENLSLDSTCPKNNTSARSKPKKVIFIRGNNSNLLTTLLLRDFNRFKKPYSIYLDEKLDIKPFEDASKIEALAKQNDCSLFIFSSHNKKRPNNVVIGRLSDGDRSLQEMVEIGVENCLSMKHFNGSKLPPEPRLHLSFEGAIFQECENYRLFKELLCEFFLGHIRDTDKLSKVDYCVKISSEDEMAKFECSRIINKCKGLKPYKTEKLGPNFDFKLRRVKLYTSDCMMDMPTDNVPIGTKYMETSLDASNNNISKLNSIPEESFVINMLEKGTKRNHDDLDERLKRMKFVD